MTSSQVWAVTRQPSKERPILFSGPMVRAILDGRKTQTRRVLSRQPSEEYSRLDVGSYHPTIIVRGEEEPGAETFGASSRDGEFAIRCPYGQPGERLWVRETFTVVPPPREVDGIDGHHDPVLYRADSLFDGMKPGDFAWRWSPSIYMPRWASRLTLEITNVRVERVQDITPDDAIAEGYDPVLRILDEYPCDWYRGLWDTLNAKRGYSWESNPWVWVIELAARVPEKNGGAVK